MRKNDQNKRINSRREQSITIYCHFTPKFVQKHHKNSKTLIIALSAPPFSRYHNPTTNASATPRSPRSFVSLRHQIHFAATIILLIQPVFLQKPPNTHCLHNNYARLGCFSSKNHQIRIISSKITPAWLVFLQKNRQINIGSTASTPLAWLVFHIIQANTPHHSNNSARSSHPHLNYVRTANTQHKYTEQTAQIRNNYAKSMQE